ncbi:unnamed protein product [Lactuca saligna]|uniref:Uncharacterized protein n=1 Tax=Lactuca saligna TaxID=75948 RepID=A0AA35YKS3_LACSI|nr:unnamed protein product [Lactuca saligna]
MGFEGKSGCSKLKRRKLAINWKQLVPSSSGDDDRPTELLVTSKRKSKCGRSEGDAQENDKEDLELQTKSYDDITEYIARSKRFLVTLSDKLPDRGEKLKATLQRYEDELERRNKLELEKSAKLLFLQVLPEAKGNVTRSLHHQQC